MRFATLISWLVTASLGGYMLHTWLARGGLRRERARAGGLPPPLIFGHAGLAISGLLIWAAFVASGARPLAWTAVGVLMVTVGLGLCTVTLWTPYPARRPGERRDATPWDEAAVVISDAAEGAAGEPGPQAYQVTDEMIARLLDDQPECQCRVRQLSVQGRHWPRRERFGELKQLHATAVRAR